MIMSAKLVILSQNGFDMKNEYYVLSFNPVLSFFFLFGTFHILLMV